MVERFADLRSIAWADWFTTWLTALKPDYSPINAYEVTLRLTTDQGIQQLNADYRDRDAPTDVLAFAAIDESYALPEEVYATQPYYLGDLIISVETAHIQALEAQHSLITELAWLASHGLLHLLGWDHPNDDDLHKMLNQQRQLLLLIAPTLAHSASRDGVSIETGTRQQSFSDCRA
jgi:probable rRNA maturation factor